MADVEPVIEDELGDVRRLIELAERAAALLAEDSTKVVDEIRKVTGRLKGRL